SRDRVTVIRNGIDPQTFRRSQPRDEAVRGSLGLSSHHVAIGAVGRLEPQKRFDLLIEAFAELHRASPDLRLVIVGEGSVGRALESQADRLGVRRECLFTGHRDDIVSVHHAFDLFVQSSEYEGTPNAVLEAMALETPVVATAVGGTTELLRD